MFLSACFDMNICVSDNFSDVLVTWELWQISNLKIVSKEWQMSEGILKITLFTVMFFLMLNQRCQNDLKEGSVCR